MAEHREMRFRVQRGIIDEERLEKLAQRIDSSNNSPSLTGRLKNSCRCTTSKLKRTVVGCLPILYWLPRYSIFDYGMADLISGISVGIMHLPQGMAYALLASLPPVFGLYSSLYPSLVYLFFGTSRHNSIGTFTIVSIMVGSVTERLAPNTNFLINGTNITAEVDITARDAYRVKVAAAVTLLGGIIQVILGLVKFGFVGTYLSEPLVRAYTTAAAFHAVVAQIKSLFGVSATSHVGPFSLVYTLVDVCSLLPQTHLPTLVVSAVSIVFLIAAKELHSVLSPRLPVPIPVELIAIVVATLISSNTNLNGIYTISVVGEIPSGLSPPSIPEYSIFREVVVDAFAMAMVGYAISISLGKTFAIKHGYKVDSNQELVALGLSNAVGAFFQCFSVSSSMSRSLIQDSTGITIFRSSATVYFANAELYLEALKQKSGLDISKIVIYKRRQEAKQRRRQKRAERRAQRQAKKQAKAIAAEQGAVGPVFSVEEEVEQMDTNMDAESEQQCRRRENGTVFVMPTTPQTPESHCSWEYLKSGDPDTTTLGSVSELQDGDTTTLGSSSEDTLSRDLERVSLGSLGKWSWDIHSIILDLSASNFIDTVAIKTMQNIVRDFAEIDVDVYIAGCQASVVEQLEQGGFFSKSITKGLVFATIHDAVLYCLDHHGASPLSRDEDSVNMQSSTKL